MLAVIITMTADSLYNRCMIDQFITRMINKKEHTLEDVLGLINYCQILIKQNDKISQQVKDSIDKIIKLEKTVKFYKDLHSER